MPALSRSELAAMRDVIETELLPDTCNILSVTNTANGMGGQTQTWGTAYSGVKCRMDMKSGREQIAADAWQEYTKYMLSLPYDAVITSSSRVELSGIIYAVVSVNPAQSWIAVKRVELEIV